MSRTDGGMDGRTDIQTDGQTSAGVSFGISIRDVDISDQPYFSVACTPPLLSLPISPPPNPNSLLPLSNRKLLMSCIRHCFLLHAPPYCITNPSQFPSPPSPLQIHYAHPHPPFCITIPSHLSFPHSKFIIATV